MNAPAISTSVHQTCFHCGDACGNDKIITGEKSFCCTGCEQVYLLLDENNLCAYYSFENNPGFKAQGKFTDGRFGYLDDASLVKKLVQFSSKNKTNVTFQLPQIHCSSCVFLLENLHRIENAVVCSSVNFLRKEVFISFDPTLISFRKVVELLAFIGYEPCISLKSAGTETVPGQEKKAINRHRRKQIYRIGIAGFCFSNIMMLSFPEYLSSGEIGDGLKELFSRLNLILSIPVLIFCAAGIFNSAWKGLQHRHMNIDIPIALAIVITFSRSYYEILSGYGPGYLDSGTGIVFFMLVGRWFQDKTYDALSFERDYRSYFPLGVTVVKETVENSMLIRKEQNIPVTKLKTGDRIIIRNEEIIPGDATLVCGIANIDYSFVNGENSPVKKQIGELIFAGGKQLGAAIELEVVQEVSRSYINRLWNNQVFKNPKQPNQSFIHLWSRNFTLGLLSIAAAAVIFWWFKNPVNILPAVTSVLIVACPCSLLLSDTFTNGNMLRIFGNNKFYLKNAGIIEALGSVDTIVFDKTGTITDPHSSGIQYFGSELSADEKNMLFHISSQSTHPYSRLIASQFQTENNRQYEIELYKEFAGLGLQATVNGIPVKIGSAFFINGAYQKDRRVDQGSLVNVQMNGEYKGYFQIGNHYREGIQTMISGLKAAGYELHVLSGDNDSEMIRLQLIFGKDTPVRFMQLPLDKLEYIKALQAANKNVLMTGDGLNDAGALMQANVGIAVNNNHAQFTPACDAILNGTRVNALHKFLFSAGQAKKIITASFILSLIYNVIGLSFAFSATLSPIVAAILMPLSSISIVMFVTITGNIIAKSHGLQSFGINTKLNK